MGRERRKGGNIGAVTYEAKKKRKIWIGGLQKLITDLDMRNGLKPKVL